MRADMGKVLVERPRKRCRFVRGLCGKGYNTRVRREMASEDGSPKHEGTMRRYGGRGDKYFNEHLGPLRRFLHANVGRPWDKVYSEICRHVDRGNVVQKHILTHLFEYVTVDVEMVDGEPHARPHTRWGYRGEPLRGRYCWYVCPKSGLLKRAPGEAKRVLRRWCDPPPYPEPPVGWVSERECVVRTPEGWQLVTVVKWVPADEQSGRKRATPRDVLLQDDDMNRVWRYYGKKVYAVAVRTLRQAELKDLPITLPGKLKAPNVVR